MAGRWDGQTVVCIASGPSLTAEDCGLVEAAKLPTVVTNTSWKLAPFADVLYGGDADWWRHNIDEVNIPAERWCFAENGASRYGLNWDSAKGPRNSGYRAIQLAIRFGAKRVLMLGYDCTVTNGAHWHGPHVKTKNPDMALCANWRKQFAAMDCHGVEIINCSRETALKCFPRLSLEDALCSFAEC